MRWMLILMAGCLATAVNAEEESAGESTVPETFEARVGYSMGLELGAGIKRQADFVEEDWIIKGIQDSLDNTEPLLTEDEIKDTLFALQTRMREKRQKDMMEAAEDNQAEGAAFMEANKDKEGVTVLPSGLQLEVITEGDGPKPKASDTVEVHYTGYLLDGTVFDSSVERGQPATFPLRGVIKGWTEGLQHMPVGSTYKLYIPPELAYGERGSPPRIGPDATLIFDIQLLDIK